MANCKKKQTTKNLDAAKAKTRANKIAKLQRQVAKNPNDYVAGYNLYIFLTDGKAQKGFAG